MAARIACRCHRGACTVLTMAPTIVLMAPYCSPVRSGTLITGAGRYGIIKSALRAATPCCRKCTYAKHRSMRAVYKQRSTVPNLLVCWVGGGFWSCALGAGRSLTGKKKNSGTSFPKTARGHSMCSTMVGGGWRLAIGGWRWLVVGSSQLAIGGGWWLAVGGGWWLAVGGGWHWDTNSIVDHWLLVHSSGGLP